MSIPATKRPATFEDLLALPGDPSVEIVGGEIVEKASPSAEHGDSQLGLGAWIRSHFNRRGGGGGGPGGWWILVEVDVELEAASFYRPDLSGWRRDRVPVKPSGRPVRLRPDWVCEILSKSNAATDLVTKFRTYHRCGVPHYWVADPENRTLTVHRWSEPGYLTVLTATQGEIVRAEPFDAVALPVGLLFGDDPED